MSEVNDDRAALPDAELPAAAEERATLPFRAGIVPSVLKGLSSELAHHPATGSWNCSVRGAWGPFIGPNTAS